MTDVASLINDAQVYAKEQLASANDALTNMKDAINSIDTSGIKAPVFPPIKEPTQYFAGAIPTLSPINLHLPAQPGAAPNLSPMPVLDINGAPVLSAQAPTFTMPEKPSAFDKFTDKPPALVTSIAFPEPPDLLMHPNITEPVLGTFSAPSAPQIVLPTFTGMMPSDNITPPSDYDVKFMSAYRDAAPTMMATLDGQIDAMLFKINPRFKEQMAALEDKLASYIAGGTGLTPAVENAIYERMRAKISAEARRARESALMSAGRRGMTMLDGVLNSSLQDITQNSVNALSSASVDIAINQAQMEQKNIQFAITTSKELRVSVLASALNYHQNLVAINGQALDYAKSILGAIIEIYNSLVKSYTAKLDAYKSEAIVYETRVKGAMAYVDLYKAEISALEALTRVDIAKVDIYKARIESLQAYANVYRSQIDAVQGKLSIEKMKVEMYGEQVRAYSTLVQGKAAEWNGYTAAINGEEAKAKIYGEQVSAYTAEVGGYRAKIEAQAESIKAVASSNEAAARQYTAIISAYDSVVSAMAKKATVEAETNRQLLDAFRVGASADEANARIGAEYYKAVNIVVDSRVKMEQEAILALANANINKAKAVADAAKGAADVHAHVAGATISGINTLVSDGQTKAG